MSESQSTLLVSGTGADLDFELAVLACTEEFLADGGNESAVNDLEAKLRWPAFQALAELASGGGTPLSFVDSIKRVEDSPYAEVKDGKLRILPSPDWPTLYSATHELAQHGTRKTADRLSTLVLHAEYLADIFAELPSGGERSRSTDVAVTHWEAWRTSGGISERTFEDGAALGCKAVAAVSNELSALRTT